MARRARYAGVQILLHWTMAAALLTLLGFGLAIGRMGFGDTVLGLGLFEAYQVHKSVGLTLGLLALARLLFRIVWPPPALPRDMPRPTRVAAAVNHYALYCLMIAMPAVGWLMVSASPLRVPTIVFGLVELPHLTAPDEALERAMMRLHGALAMLFAVLIAVHVIAALKHAVVDRDGVLDRMLPWARRGSARRAFGRSGAE
ncbi:MAG: cytochrome b [Azospirillaceae bacterium]